MILENDHLIAATLAAHAPEMQVETPIYSCVRCQEDCATPGYCEVCAAEIDAEMKHELMINDFAPLGPCVLCGDDAWMTTRIGLLCPQHETEDPAVSLPTDTAQAIDSAEETRASSCLACGGAHPIQQCPAIARFDPWAEAKGAQETIAALRAQLAAAHEAMGGLLANAGRLRVEAMHYLSTGVGGTHLQTAIDDAEPALRYARTWLRRGEGE